MVYKLPQLKKLSNYRCFEHILENLKKRELDFVEKVTFKRDLLIFYVGHPTDRFYLKHNLEDLEEILHSYRFCENILQKYSGFKIYLSKDWIS